MLDHDAAVHHYVDAAGFGAGGGFLMDDSLLDPEVGKAELEHLFDDGRNEFGKAEDIDDVGSDGEISEACVGFFAEDLRDGGIDGVNFVAVLLHVLGDVVTGLGWDFGEADDGDGARVFFRGDAKDGADDFGFVHFLFRLPFNEQTNLRQATANTGVLHCVQDDNFHCDQDDGFELMPMLVGPCVEEAAEDDEFAEMVGVVVGDEESFAEKVLAVAPAKGFEEV